MLKIGRSLGGLFSGVAGPLAAYRAVVRFGALSPF